MKNTTFYFLLSTFYFLLQSPTVSADENIICNSCNYSSMQSKAFNKVKSLTDNDSMSSIYTINVISVSTGVVKSFVVTSQPKIGRFGELETLISTHAVSPPSYLVNQTHSAQRQFSVMSSRISVPIESGFESAWDVAQNSSNRSSLDQWFLDNHPITYWSRQITSTFGGSLFSPLAGTEWEFEFSDESTLVMVAATSTSSRLTFSYKEKSAQDKDGNRIPDAGLSAQGEYTFSSENSLSNFLKKLDMYGVKVTVIRSGSTGGRRKITITDRNQY